MSVSRDLRASKGKFQKIISTENVNFFASGDGAAAGRCCRLCSGDTSLRALCDTYLWEGVEERYDQLLYDCFGVRVSKTDSLICEWCIRQLRNAERFRALVNAAFDKPSDSSFPSQNDTPNLQDDVKESTYIIPDNKNIGIIDNKGIIKLLKNRMSNDKKRSNAKKPLQMKRTNVLCNVCKQKYIMIISEECCKEFVCSRCKKDDQSICRKQNMAALRKENMGLHLKADLRGKYRQLSPSKKPSETKRQENTARNRLAKFKCSICPKKYTTSEHLVEHVRLLHNGRKSTICVICGKNFRTKDVLDKHIQKHKDEKSFSSLCYPGCQKYGSKMYGFAREKRIV